MMRLYTVILDQDITYGIFKHWGCVLQVVSQVSIGFLFGFHCNDDLLHNMRVKKQHNYEGCHVRKCLDCKGTSSDLYRGSGLDERMDCSQSIYCKLYDSSMIDTLSSDWHILLTNSLILLLKFYQLPPSAWWWRWGWSWWHSTIRSCVHFQRQHHIYVWTSRPRRRPLHVI